MWLHRKPRSWPQDQKQNADSQAATKPCVQQQLSLQAVGHLIYNQSQSFMTSRVTFSR